MDGSIQKITACPCFDNRAEAAVSGTPQAGLRGRPA